MPGILVKENMRVIMGWFGTDALEFPHADMNDRGTGIVMKMRSVFMGHEASLKQKFAKIDIWKLDPWKAYE